MPSARNDAPRDESTSTSTHITTSPEARCQKDEGQNGRGTNCCGCAETEEGHRDDDRHTTGLLLHRLSHNNPPKKKHWQKAAAPKVLADQAQKRWWLKITPWERGNDDSTPVVHDCHSSKDCGRPGLRAKLLHLWEHR